MYTIKDLRDFDFIPSNQLYANDAWYVNTYQHVKKILIKFFGKRELQIDEDLIFENLDKIKNNTFLSGVIVDEISDNIDTLFIMNREKYNHFYDVLTAKYNPIWNVDGSETLIYTKDNTGNQSITGSNTGTVTDSGTVGGTVDTVTKNTGTVTDNGNVGGTVNTVTKNTGTVSDSGSNGGSSTDYVTTYDSNNFLESTKKQDSYTTSNSRTDNLLEDTTQTNNLTNGNTRTDDLKQDVTQTNNLTNSNTRTDNLQHSNSRLDNLHESYSETKTRGGNIGVTMTQQLIAAELDLRDKYNFIEILCRDIANVISYSVY